MELKQISSNDLCEELNHRHGRINRKAIPELADTGTEKLVAELIGRSGIQSGIELAAITNDAECHLELSENGKNYDATLKSPAFVLTIKL